MSIGERLRGRGAEAAPPYCNAPTTAMRFAPGGEVLVCCVNEAYPLGRVGEASLHDIWFGERAEALRAAIAGGDFSLGCEPCGEARALGQRERSLVVDFDRLRPRRRWPRHLELALSNTCNLQCVQCNGDLSSAIRAQREHRPPLRSPYDDGFFAELDPFLRHVESLTFIGGEPFLMRECRRVWDRLLERGRRPMVWVTTNGTVWDDRVERYVRELAMGISLSIDGVRPETIEAIRVGADAEALLANRDRFLDATRAVGASFKLNFCLMPQNWREFFEYLVEADRLEVPVYRARVERPTHLSLYHLPLDELAAVVEELTEQGDAEADRLGRNRPVWDQALLDLTVHLAERRAREVAVDPPRRRPPVSPSALRDRLSGEGRPAPLELELVQGRVRQRSSPAWAVSLGLGGLDGVEEAQLFDAIGRGVGAPLHLEPVPGEDDVAGYRCRFDTDAGPVVLHSLSSEDEAEGATHVLIALDAPPPA